MFKAKLKTWTVVGAPGVLIPERLHHGIEAYAFDHQQPGSFLMAVFMNDLKAAVGRADPDCIGALPTLSGFLRFEMPMGSSGSREIVSKWLNRAPNR